MKFSLFIANVDKTKRIIMIILWGTRKTFLLEDQLVL